MADESGAPGAPRRRTGWRRRSLTTLLLTGILAVVTLWLPARPAGAVSADTGATVIRETWVDGRTLDIAIQSPSIDAATKWVRLLLPPNWSKTASRTWPTLYLLHGGVDDHKSFTNNTDIEQLAASRNAIIVMPETSWCSAYSDWWNYGSGGVPKWQTFVTTEVRQILERGYRASTVRSVAGVSMGGLGSMKFAATFPGMFRAAAAFSGNVDPLHSYSNSSDGFDKPGLGCGADWKRVWGDPAIPAQRDIWKRNNPYDLAARLAGTQLYVSSGDGSWWDSVERQVKVESVAFVNRLRSLGIPVTSHYYSGTHGWGAWQGELRAAFPMLMSSIGA